MTPRPMLRALVGRLSWGTSMTTLVHIPKALSLDRIRKMPLMELMVAVSNSKLEITGII